ncbi:MAG: 4Fe-4S binding protein [Chloroflexi bacterium]|nr:4Fe-4S binding protein [Chloroflexota bacterium]
MVNLEIKFAGVKMRSPIGIAPHGLTFSEGHDPKRLSAHLLRYVQAGAGYVYTPITVLAKPRPGNSRGGTSRCIKESVRGFGTRMGLFGISDVNNVVHRVEEIAETIWLLKPQLPEDVPIIANPQGSGADIESWIKVSKELERAGADILELNMSCPLAVFRETTKGDARYVLIQSELSQLSPETRAMGLRAILGDSPGAIAPIVKAVTEAVKIPVGVKPSAEAGFPRIVDIYKSISNNGGKFITNINVPITFAPPDIYNGGRGKFPKFGGLNPMCSTYGPWDRWLTLKCLGAGIMYVPEVDYAAVGGIVIPEHMIEMMMLGAKNIQLSSALFFEGIKVLPRFTRFLQDYMQKQGYESVNDFIGIAKQYIRPIDEKTEWYTEKIVVKLDKAICTKCGKCAPNLCFAMPGPDADGYPDIDGAICVGCGRCAAICPVGALAVVDR